MSRKASLYFLAILLGCVVLISGCSFLSNSKTYRNDEIGYEMKIPKEWKVNKEEKKELSHSLEIEDDKLQEKLYIGFGKIARDERHKDKVFLFDEIGEKEREDFLKRFTSMSYTLESGYLKLDDGHIAMFHYVQSVDKDKKRSYKYLLMVIRGNDQFKVTWTSQSDIKPSNEKMNEIIKMMKTFKMDKKALSDYPYEKDFFLYENKTKGYQISLPVSTRITEDKKGDFTAYHGNEGIVTFAGWQFDVSYLSKEGFFLD